MLEKSERCKARGIGLGELAVILIVFGFIAGVIMTNSTLVYYSSVSHTCSLELLLKYVIIFFTIVIMILLGVIILEVQKLRKRLDNAS